MTSSVVFKKTHLFNEGKQESFYQPNKGHSVKDFQKTTDAKRLTEPILYVPKFYSEQGITFNITFVIKKVSFFLLLY